MSNESIPDFLKDIIFGNKGYPFSESDIISSYIDGKISKEEYIRRMNEFRGKSRK
jgi:hypothetical protein